MFGQGLMPVDKDSIRFVSAFRLIHELRQDELDALKNDDKHYDQKRSAIHRKYHKKELALLRNTAGHLLQIVEQDA